MSGSKVGTRQKEIRVGIGSDDHRIKILIPQQNGYTVKPVTLSGKVVSTEYSIDANSDGDVVYHAVINAILLAAGKRDIGYYFPDTKGGEWTGKSSEIMVNLVMDMIKNDGWAVNNAAVMITAGAPRLKEHIGDMRQNLARVLEIDLGSDQSRIGIGATTREKLSAVARKEGIHADAVVSLLRP